MPITPAQTHASPPLSEHTVAVNGARVIAKVFREGASTAVEITSGPGLIAPDVLVYASASESGGSVPAGAMLLGTFTSGKFYRLPAANSRFVLLYSLPRKEVLATFAIGDER
jgi:hypothetical protein